MKLELLNIAATEDGIYEYEEERLLTFVPAKDIKKISFGFVVPVRWPLISLLIGVAMIFVGIARGTANNQSYHYKRKFRLLCVQRL